MRFAHNRPFIAAAVVLGVAMGVGRFVYTPLLVVMRADAHLSVAYSGVLASANLAGYLLGAMFSILEFARRKRVLLICAGSIVVVLTTAMMALGPQVWFAARLLTGIASGVVFVLTTSLLLDVSAQTPSRFGIAIMFAGVGIGIAGATILSIPFIVAGGSRAAWLGLAAISGLLLAAALPLLPRVSGARAPSSARRSAGGRAMFAWLALLYGLEGAAYIVPATFLVAMVAETPSIRSYGDAAWIVVGLVAAPSSLWWNAAGRRLGLRAALVIACAAQIAGMLAPFVLPGAIGAALLAISLGGTFVGIVALSTALARTIWPENVNAAIGILTALYGAGQIVGPLVATRVALITGSYRVSLVIAAGAFALAVAAFALSALRGADHLRSDE